MIRRRRRPFYPSGQDDPQIRELEERYHEVRCRVRDDNPRDVVLLKVQKRRWLMNLEPLVGKVAARQYPAVQQLDRLIEDWYQQSQPPTGQASCRADIPSTVSPSQRVVL